MPDPITRRFLEDGRERILLPPRVPTELRTVALSEAPIEILHYRPPATFDGPRPLVLISPILGNRTLLVGPFAQAFSRAGLHAAIVQRKDLAFDPEISVARAEDEVRLLVMRSRQALDWLLTQDAVDASRVGTFGISAGAVVSSMVAGADPRTSAHVWLLGGGPLSDVMVHTAEAEYRNYTSAALRASGLRLSQIRDDLRASIRTDPLRLASRVAREDVLLVLARFDRSVPYRYGLALWRALGKPERIICPFGHYTSLVLLPWLREQAFRFFQQRFAESTTA